MLSVIPDSATKGKLQICDMGLYESLSTVGKSLRMVALHVGPIFPLPDVDIIHKQACRDQTQLTKMVARGLINGENTVVPFS